MINVVKGCKISNGEKGNYNKDDLMSFYVISELDINDKSDNVNYVCRNGYEGCLFILLDYNYW